MPNSRLSICIATYNRAEILSGTLEHLTGANDIDMEIVVSDNCSTDDTAKVVKGFGKRIDKLTYFRQASNRGPMVNFGTAVSMATGDYVYTLSDDDRIIPEGLAAAIQILDAQPDIVGVFGGYQEWDQTDDQVLHTYRQTDRPLTFGPADRIRLLNEISALWFPVARRRTLQRHCEYDAHTWGLMRLAGQLVARGGIMIVPDLFYKHAHTESRLEHELTEPWYHDHHRSDYELFIADFVEQADVAQVGHFVALRTAPAYVHAARFAQRKKQYAKARHYLLRAKAYGTFVGDALVDWEKKNLIHVMLDRLKLMLESQPSVRILVFEDCELADRCIATASEDFPELPEAVKVSAEDLVSRRPSDEQFLLANDYKTLERRAEQFSPAPSRQVALTDLMEGSRVTGQAP